MNHMQCTSTSAKYMFSVETMVLGYRIDYTIYGYHEYQNAWDTPIGEILSCEKEVGNIHDTFVVAIKIYGEGSHMIRCNNSYLWNAKPVMS